MDISTSRMRDWRARLSRRFIFGLLIVVALCAGAVSSGSTGKIPQQGNAKVNTQNAGSTAGDERKLEFVVSVENHKWKKGEPILVKLRVHNAGKDPIGGICSFELRDPLTGNDPYKQGRNLWAPVFVKAEGIQPITGSGSSRLNPGQTIELEVDLNKLNWGTAIQSMWPNENLSQKGATGDYELSFSMNVYPRGTSEKIESNKVKVSIN